MELSDGLAQMPPGPELAVVLDGIDRRALDGHDCVELMRARARQVAFDQAQLLADLHEVAHRAAADSTDRSTTVGRYAPAEIAAALSWSGFTAAVQLGVALDLIERLPAVGDALTLGQIDLQRARAIGELLRSLPDSTATQAADWILLSAPDLTVGQVRAKLDRLVIGLDPDAARRRRARAVDERKVTRRVDGDGVATVTALGLPVERAAAAMERLDALARAARAAGDDRTLDQLRADLLLALLDGTFIGAQPARRKGVVDLIVPLAVLTGESDQPAEIPGWGPVLAELARSLADDPLGEAQMRADIIGEDGRLVAVCHIRRRPTEAQARHVRARDHTCRAIGCPRSATRADIDHTQAWSDDGPTLVDNLGVLCRYHHRMKHLGDWRLLQHLAGEFTWTSPLGHNYHRGEDHPTTGPPDNPPRTNPTPGDPTPGDPSTDEPSTHEPSPGNRPHGDRASDDPPPEESPPQESPPDETIPF